MFSRNPRPGAVLFHRHAIASLRQYRFEAKGGFEAGPEHP